MKEYPFHQQTLGQILEDKVKTHSDSPFLQFEGKSPITYGEVDEITNRIAKGLNAIGLKKGDKLATFLPNCLEEVFIWFGSAKAGIIEVPINIANKGDFLSHIINASDSKALVIDYQLIDRVKFIENNLPKLEKVVIVTRSLNAEEIPKLKFRTYDYNELLNNPTERVKVDVRANEPQQIIFTSGTTGPAKPVLHCHAHIYHSAFEYIEASRSTSADIFFTCLPMFHANARILSVYPAMLLGTRVSIYERFSASRFWEWIRESKATVFNSLGAMANFIYMQPKRPEDADNPVRVCMAYPMPKEIYEGFEKRFNLKVVEGYGLTELAIITYNPWDEPRIGSCGKATKSFEISIVDENDFPLPAGVAGEIVARPKVPWVAALGYYNMPEKTVELLRNCFYHTGDAGYLDKDGYLYFVDRVKDYIRRRGENISSFEIERVINSHHKVAESAAIGVKSELAEDEVKIVVVLKEGEKLTPEELLDFCQERMPYFAIPRYVEFVKNLPKTPTDRVQKNILREAGITANTWDREKVGYKIKR